MRRKGRTVKRGWRSSRRGMAGAVTAVLFVIIITTMLAGVMLYYVPAWSKEAENEHMNKVANQFFTIRDGINDQIAKGEGGNSLYSHVALASGATPSFLGMQGEPSQGTLTLDTGSSIFEIHDTDRPEEIYALAKGSLSFRSRNIYYVQQEYSYEEGAVLVRQGGSTTVREGTPPEFHRDAWGCLTLTITLYSLFGENTSVTGTGSAGVETLILHTEETSMPFPAGRNLTLNATSPNGDGWVRWINSSILSTGNVENITAQNFSVYQTPYGFRMDAYGVITLTIRLAVVQAKVSK